MPIPKHISASAGLAKSSLYSGEIDPASLSRLKPELVADQGPLQVEVGLDQNVRGKWLQGFVRGSLGLECRRCLKPFAWPVNLPLELKLVSSEAEERLALESVDPYRVPEDDQLPLHEIVEDELLLALPMLPRCQECRDAEPDEPAPAVAVEDEASRRTTNPFANLKNELTGAGRPRRK